MITPCVIITNWFMLACPMVYTNENFGKLKTEYVFPIIEKKIAELKKKQPHAKLINLGIGDIALPLATSIVQAVCDAAKEMGKEKKGYGPTKGYPFLREAIALNEFAHLGISPDEIFISEGINNDAANIQELFGPTNTIAIPDPTYPVYRDANILAGRSDKIIYLPCTEETGFLPRPPKEHADIVYLCSPNNPTGMALSRKEMTAWVNYAIQEKAIIIHDNAYVSFITSSDVPRSIFEIEGAEKVAIELRSFSKTAGFTGLRCSFAIVLKTLGAHLGQPAPSLYDLWTKRQDIKTNGISYITQKAAAVVYTPQGKEETRAQVMTYLEAGKKLREGLSLYGFEYYGGIDSPYIWMRTHKNMKSWDFFNLLLEECHLVTIPGKGFSPLGEGFIRLSTFTKPNIAKEAVQRLCALL